MTAMEAAEQAMCRPWSWGLADCCTAACDAFALMHGVDPMGPLRGRYATQAEATAAIRARGGWVAMTDALALAAALTPVDPDDAAPGLIGRSRRALLFSVGGGWWAGKSAGGMTIRRGEATAAWRF